MPSLLKVPNVSIIGLENTIKIAAKKLTHKLIDVTTTESFIIESKVLSVNRAW